MSGEPDAKRSTMSALEQLKEMTVIVADTGDFEGEFESDESSRHFNNSNWNSFRKS